ncbi:MAG: ATP-grasp domain-containing protein, partial [Clostridium sp.]|uniref:ATP-grasp domain-containing protein n=1 Tax=Clostridium sp. TaxID=1506 RepID=UPI003EE6D1AD
NIRTADWFVVKSIEDINYDKIEEYGYPVMVKPVSGGGSVATFIVKKKEDVEEAVREGLLWDEEIMIEKFIPGATEITCPVVDGKMLPVIQIDPKGEFFDYQSKYTAEGSDRYTVELPKELHEEVEKMAVATYYALKTSVYTRVDMLVKDGVPYVLEVNTLPGMTKNSLYPVSLKTAGIEVSDFLDTVIEKSLEVRRKVEALDNARNNGVTVKEK